MHLFAYIFSIEFENKMNNRLPFKGRELLSLLYFQQVKVGNEFACTAGTSEQQCMPPAQTAQIWTRNKSESCHYESLHCCSVILSVI